MILTKTLFTVFAVALAFTAVRQNKTGVAYAEVGVLENSGSATPKISVAYSISAAKGGFKDQTQEVKSSYAVVQALGVLGKEGWRLVGPCAANKNCYIMKRPYKLP